MDALFKDLLEKIDNLLAVGQDALDGPLSAVGEKDKLNDFLPIAKKGWAGYLSEIKEKRDLLEQAIQNSDAYERSKELSQRLAYFRSLSRRLSEGADPVWSAYYPDISQLMDKMAIQRSNIDEQYKLGWYKDD